MTSPSPPLTSPSIPPSGAEALSRLSPGSLDELFSRDPLGLGDADLERIVVELRAQRVKWRQAEAAGKRSAPRGAAKVAAPDGLSLEDLGG